MTASDADDTSSIFGEFSEAAAEMAETISQKPPFALRSQVLHAALTRRPGSSGVRRPTSAVAAYVTLTTALDMLLENLDDDAAWLTPVTDELNIRELVVHLTIVDRIATHAFTGPTLLDVDVADETTRAIAAGVDKSTSMIRTEWRRQTRELESLATAMHHDSATVTYLGMPLTVEQVVIDRAFETWLHAQDIRRALGLPIEAPEPGALGLMTDLGARLLPLVLGREQQSHTARLVLPGRGGGTWLVPFGPTANATDPTVTLTLDPLSFCLVIADRLSITDVVCHMEGDTEVGAWLLSHASELARL